MGSGHVLGKATAAPIFKPPPPSGGEGEGEGKE
jgi:hypothetical protein